MNELKHTNIYKILDSMHSTYKYKETFYQNPNIDYNKLNLIIDTVVDYIKEFKPEN